MSEEPVEVSQNVEERRSGTLLVIDDDDGVRRVASRMLERDGYRVHAASARAEALDVFDAFRNEIDAVLVDLTMPDCNGVDLAEELRRRAGDGVALPILYMSGHSPEDSDASSSRVRPFIHKPFSRRQLGEAIRELLAGVDGEG